MSLNGKKVTDFSLQAYQKGAFKEITSHALEGKWSVFFFYPADFTFVCPTELGDLQDKYEEFRKINCEIYSVSCDTHFVHKAWHESSTTVGKVEFPMIGDPTGILAKDLEVYIEDAGRSVPGQMETGQQDLKTGIRLSGENLINFIRPASMRCGSFCVSTRNGRGSIIDNITISI